MIDSENVADPENGHEALPDDQRKQPGLTDAPLSISNVSSLFNVSRFTLLSYEYLGVMRRRRRVGRRQVYSGVDCDRLSFMIKAGRLGLTARQVAPIIRATEPGATVASIKEARARCLELTDQLDNRRRDLRDSLAELRRLHALLSTMLAKLQDCGVVPGDRHRDP